jgi:hypothetical protein
LLESVLVTALKDGRKVTDEAYERYETAYDEARASFEQEVKEWTVANERSEERQNKLANQLSEMVDQIIGQVDYELGDKVWEMYGDMSSELEDEERRLVEVKKRIEEDNAQNKKKLDRYFKVYQEKDGIARERAKTCHLIAEMAGLNLRQ